MVLLSIVVVLSTCGSDSSTPLLELRLKRAEDSADVILSKNAATVLLTSSSGIGEAEIVLRGGHWPDTMRVRLQYEAGRGFHRLESFTVQSDSLLARTAFGRPGMVPLYCIKAHTKIDSSAICGETRIPLDKRDDFIEATIPQVFLSQGVKRLNLSWIDMYRR
jgi:hypothetical protein